MVVVGQARLGGLMTEENGGRRRLSDVVLVFLNQDWMFKQWRTVGKS